ncbi:MAG: response regulator, partial [Chloroflexota bacterium]
MDVISDINQPKILVVDDEPINLGVLFDYLRTEGFKVWLADSGPDALATLEYDHPDLILLDVVMPELDGFEVCRRIKNQPATQDIPIIFLTAKSDTLDKVKGFQLGAVDYITKPLEIEEVLARISRHLDIHKAQKQYKQQISQLKQQVQPSNSSSDASSSQDTATLEDYDLNEREAKVLSLFVAGYKRTEIATEMMVTQNTVKWYLKNIYLKLGVNRRADAI